MPVSMVAYFYGDLFLRSRVSTVACFYGRVLPWSRVSLVMCFYGHVFLWSRVSLVACFYGHVFLRSHVSMVTCYFGHVFLWSLFFHSHNIKYIASHRWLRIPMTAGRLAHPLLTFSTFWNPFFSNSIGRPETWGSLKWKQLETGSFQAVYTVHSFQNLSQQLFHFSSSFPSSTTIATISTITLWNNLANS